ncbi:MAG: carboxymuconolactone decarboxylase family protein [Chloroflexi bacterium]|nr:carboxymuconolactone decarboxylase family protein [Chloroflexota bacterium]
MSRVRLLSKAEAPPEAKEIYDKLEANGAAVINIYRTIAHSPEVLRNFLRMGSALLTKAELSARLRELAILRVARLSGSEYEWAQHYSVALEVGVTREQTEAIGNWREVACFNDEERAVLQYTDEVAQNVKVSEETFKNLQRFLSERSIVELTISIGFWGMVARVLVPLQVDIDMRPVGSAQDLVGRKRKAGG